MKRMICYLLTVFLIFYGESAFAAKARSIDSDADSAYHSRHLQFHVGCTGCHTTGNYIKTRTKANGNNVIGHLEQADEFILLEMTDGWARIEVTFSAETSPDSWMGMTGWVNADYIDCNCSTYDYLNNNVSSYSYLADDYRCKVNYLRVRNAPDGPKILGHIEQADRFAVTEIIDGWAHIIVVYSDKTSPDSWVGLSGWVSMKYLEKAADLFSSIDWKNAYRNYVSENHLIDYSDDAVFWFAYIDKDSIPELIIDTKYVAGGCHVLSYQDGWIAHTLIGNTGISSYIEEGNLLLNSAGHQGCYYDTVFQIVNGSWVELYHAENFEEPSATYEIDSQALHTYFINHIEVSKDEYYSTLYRYFDPNKAIRLNEGTNIAYLDLALR